MDEILASNFIWALSKYISWVLYNKIIKYPTLASLMIGNKLLVCHWLSHSRADNKVGQSALNTGKLLDLLI